VHRTSTHRLVPEVVGELCCCGSLLGAIFVKGASLPLRGTHPLFYERDERGDYFSEGDECPAGHPRSHVLPGGGTVQANEARHNCQCRCRCSTERNQRNPQPPLVTREHSIPISQTITDFLYYGIELFKNNLSLRLCFFALECFNIQRKGITMSHIHADPHADMCQCEGEEGECHCHHDDAPSHRSLKQRVIPYRALLIALGLVLIFATGATWVTGYAELHVFMQYLMAGYFLIFGIMQTLHLKKSAHMLQQYDPIAKRLHAYGYVYPLLQIALGAAYLFWIAPIVVNGIAATVLFFTMIGVIDVLENKKKVRCGCLGEAMNVSVSWVTLLENAIMFVMACGMLIYFFATLAPNNPHTDGGASGQHQHRGL